MTTNRIVALFTLSLAIGLIACGGPEKKIDVVNGIEPVSTAFGDIHGFAREIAALPEADRKAFLERSKPHLATAIAYYLKAERVIRATDKVERIQYFFGTLDHVEALDKQGKKHKGYFKDQLVARVSVEGRKEPIDVLVQCLNGWVELPGNVKRLQDLGTYDVATRFTIQEGEGLTRHVDYDMAIDLAERFNLDLYRGQTMIPRREITAERARRINTDEVQVTVRVYEGDVFDLNTMTYTPSPKR